MPVLDFHRGLGLHRSVPRRGDPKFGVHFDLGDFDPPASVNNDDFIPSSEIEDQGRLQCCVGESTSYALRAAQQRELREAGSSERAPKVSVLATYYWTRAIRGEETNDSGAFIPDAFTVYQRIGVVPDAFWPFDPSRVNDEPTDLVARAAVDNAFKNAYAIQDTDPAVIKRRIQQALSQRYPMVIGTLLDNRIFNWKKSDGPYQRKETAIGGHALCALSYDQNMVRGPNSWSSVWGDNGFYEMSWDQILSPETGDKWVVVAAPILRGDA